MKNNVYKIPRWNGIAEGRPAMHSLVTTRKKDNTEMTDVKAAESWEDSELEGLMLQRGKNLKQAGTKWPKGKQRKEDSNKEQQNDNYKDKHNWKLKFS